MEQSYERHFPIADMRHVQGTPWLQGSQVMLSMSAKAESAVVFVHGWNGRALGSWEMFPRHMRSLKRPDVPDIFFLQYPSKTHSVAICGARVAEFLLDLLRQPAEAILNPSLPNSRKSRSLADRYKRIVLVGHSMGAVVTRRALLDLDRDDLTLEERAILRMLFFAPAHKGSDLPLLVESGLGIEMLPGAGLIGKLVTQWLRSLKDLKEGSQALDDLATDSSAARARRKAEEKPDVYLRAHCRHADGDRVVVQEKFDDDPRTIPLPGNHRTVCKPTAKYLDPATELEKLL